VHRSRPQRVLISVLAITTMLLRTARSTLGRYTEHLPLLLVTENLSLEQPCDDSAHRFLAPGRGTCGACGSRACVERSGGRSSMSGAALSSAPIWLSRFVAPGSLSSRAFSQATAPRTGNSNFLNPAVCQDSRNPVRIRSGFARATQKSDRTATDRWRFERPSEVKLRRDRSSSFARRRLGQAFAISKPQLVLVTGGAIPSRRFGAVRFLVEDGGCDDVERQGRRAFHGVIRLGGLNLTSVNVVILPRRILMPRSVRSTATPKGC